MNMQWQAHDMIALFIILGVIVLAILGVQSPLTDFLGIIVGFYFGQKIGQNGGTN